MPAIQVNGLNVFVAEVARLQISELSRVQLPLATEHFQFESPNQ